jgi:hypothetical protein
VLEDAQMRELAARGFVRLSIADEGALLALGESLGDVVAARPRGALVDRLVPVPATGAPRRSLSSIHGLGSFPFHTDAAHHRCPPRYLVMRCEDPGPAGRATMLIDFSGLAFADRHIRLLERAVWTVLSGPRPFLTSVLSRRLNDGMAIRYDPGCMRVADKVFDEARQVLESALLRAPVNLIAWERGGGLVVDNWRVLHGRQDAGTADMGLRVLHRVLIARP